MSEPSIIVAISIEDGWRSSVFKDWSYKQFYLYNDFLAAVVLMQIFIMVGTVSNGSFGLFAFGIFFSIVCLKAYIYGRMKKLEPEK